MLTIEFYKHPSSSCPVEGFLDALNSKQAQKVVWVLDLIRTLPRPPKQEIKTAEHRMKDYFSRKG